LGEAGGKAGAGGGLADPAFAGGYDDDSGHVDFSLGKLLKIY
jgi:hypothetical protein